MTENLTEKLVKGFKKEYQQIHQKKNLETINGVEKENLIDNLSGVGGWSTERLTEEAANLMKRGGGGDYWGET